jgi:hypothetical protein
MYLGDNVTANGNLMGEHIMTKEVHEEQWQNLRGPSWTATNKED